MMMILQWMATTENVYFKKTGVHFSNRFITALFSCLVYMEGFCAGETSLNYASDKCSSWEEKRVRFHQKHLKKMCVCILSNRDYVHVTNQCLISKMLLYVFSLYYILVSKEKKLSAKDLDTLA